MESLRTSKWVHSVEQRVCALFRICRKVLRHITWCKDRTLQGFQWFFQIGQCNGYIWISKFMFELMGRLSSLIRIILFQSKLWILYCYLCQRICEWFSNTRSEHIFLRLPVIIFELVNCNIFHEKTKRKLWIWRKYIFFVKPITSFSFFVKSIQIWYIYI